MKITKKDTKSNSITIKLLNIIIHTNKEEREKENQINITLSLQICLIISTMKFLKNLKTNIF